MHKLEFFKCLKVRFDLFDCSCTLPFQTSSVWLAFYHSANPARGWQFRLFMLWSTLGKMLNLHLLFITLSPSWAQWQESWSLEEDTGTSINFSATGLYYGYIYTAKKSLLWDFDYMVQSSHIYPVLDWLLRNGSSGSMGHHVQLWTYQGASVALRYNY